MNQQQKEQWVAALRSGLYPQIRSGALQTEKGYCCLGVANEIFGLSSDSSSYLRSGVKEIFLPIGTQSQLANLNDSVWSFAQIADYIERQILPTE